MNPRSERLRTCVYGLVALLAIATVAAKSASSAASPAAIVAGAVKALPGHVAPRAVSCPAGRAVAATTCSVLGSTGSSATLLPVTNGTPSTPATDVGAGDNVACMTATTCLVVGSSPRQIGTLQWVTNGRVTKTVALVGSSFLYGVTCGISSCVVVGERFSAKTPTGIGTSGVVARVTETQSSPVALKVPSVSALRDVACASSTTCYAVGATKANSSGAGAVVPFVSSRVGATLLVARSYALTHVACGSTSTCWATGVTSTAQPTVFVKITQGKVGAVVASREIGGSIACTGASTCFLASGTAPFGHGKVDELVNGAVAGSVVLRGFAYGPLSGIACPTKPACMATGITAIHRSGSTTYFTGGVVTLHT